MDCAGAGSVKRRRACRYAVRCGGGGGRCRNAVTTVINIVANDVFMLLIGASAAAAAAAVAEVINHPHIHITILCGGGDIGAAGRRCALSASFGSLLLLLLLRCCRDVVVRCRRGGIGDSRFSRIDSLAAD